jgi:hypothetical protein
MAATSKFLYWKLQEATRFVRPERGQTAYFKGLLPICGLVGMYGPPPECKRKRVGGLVCANVYGLRWSQMTPGQDGMRCARVPFSDAVLEDFFLQRVFRAPGSTVVPSPGSFADLAGSENLPSPESDSP